MASINARSRENMVFTTEAHVRAAVYGLALPGDEPPERIPMPPQPDCWVYFIQAGDNGPIKIGYSRDPWTRFCGIQTGSPVEHTYLGNVPGGIHEEHELHLRFDRFRIRGEWFEPAPEILDYIETYRFRRDTEWVPGPTPMPDFPDPEYKTDPHALF